MLPSSLIERGQETFLKAQLRRVQEQGWGCWKYFPAVKFWQRLEADGDREEWRLGELKRRSQQVALINT